MFRKIKIRHVALFSWTSLGFYRGMNHYDYMHYNYYDKQIDKPLYLYTNRLKSGILGSLLYINPFFLFFIIHKELYRLEVNIRKMEDEKHTENYNTIL